MLLKRQQKKNWQSLRSWILIKNNFYIGCDKLKQKKAISYLLIAFMLGILIAFLFYYLVVVDSRQSYEMQLEVSDVAGFNIGTDKVYFSKIPPGGTGKRTLLMFGNEDRDVMVVFEVKGDLQPWIVLEENSFVLPANTSRNLTIQAIVPTNATIGTNMTGVLKATFLRYW